MTLFGTTLDGPQIAALVGLLATLVLWLFVLRGERGYSRWFRRWEADRKTQRLAEEGKSKPVDPKGPPRGPWG